MEPGTRRATVALAFAVAALLACWNPLSAPFAILTGLGALVLGLRARGATKAARRAALAGVAVAALAIALGAAVLAVAAGAGRDLSGATVVEARSPEEVERLLDRAAKESEAARARAREEVLRAADPPLTPEGE